MSNITELEKDVLLNGFCKSDFYERGLDSIIWSNSMGDTKAKGRQLSAIVSSLVQKGIMIKEGSGNDSTIYLTPKGKEVVKLLQLTSL